MSPLGQKRTCAVHLGMSAMGQKRTFRDLLDHLVNAWNTRTATVAKCFKRFVKLGLKNEEQIAEPAVN
jgi:hypothetical protein